MKRWWLTPTFLAALSALAAPSARGALVAHWPLSAGSGTTAQDVQNGYDGALGGGAALISGDATRGNVLELDGVNSRVDLSDNVGSFSAQQSGTVTGWFLYDDTDAIGAILTLSNSTVGSTEGRLFVETGRLRWDVRDEGGNPPGENGMLASQEGVDDGAWHHFALTVDSAAQISRLYLNGLMVGAGDGASAFPNGYEPFWGQITDSVGTLDTMAIGSNTDNTGLQWFWGGRLSDVAIYDTALTPGQVRDVMTNGVSATPAELEPLTRSAGVVAHYKFNNGAVGAAVAVGETVVDETGNNAGTILGDSLQYVAGVDGTALRFSADAATGHRLEIPNSDDFYVLPGEGFTVEAVYRTDASGTIGLVAKAGNGGETWMRLENGELRWFLNDAALGSLDVRSLASEGELANTGAWTHAAGVYDPAAAEVRLYLNGELVDAKAAPGSWAAPLNGDGNPLVIGDFFAAANRKFIGDIDEVRITRGALTPAEFLTIPIPEPQAALLALASVALGSARRRRG